MRKDNGRTSGFSIVLLAGLIFTAVACFLLVRTADFSKNGEKAEAVITDIYERYNGDDTDYYVTVEFFVDGKKYSGLLGTYETGFYEGKTVPIIYKRDNPKEFIYGKRNTFIAFMFLIGGLALLFSTLGYWVYLLILKIKLAVYRNIGEKKYATVTRIESSKKPFLGIEPTLVSFTGEDGIIYEKTFLYGADGLEEGEEVLLLVKIGGNSFAVENNDKR